VRFAALALLLLLPSACNRPRWDTPVNAYLSFTRLMQKEDLKAAYQALSTPTRSVLSERSKALAKTAGGSLRDEPAYHLFTPGLRPPEVTSVEVVKQEENIAVLSVQSGGQRQEVQMVKEADGWRVDLSNQLKDSPATGAADGAGAPG
jgi:hypothetical protein